MSYQIAITEKPGYLHCVVTGKNTMENVAAYLQEIARECEARNCFRVLIEEHLVGRRLETSSERSRPWPMWTSTPKAS